MSAWYYNMFIILMSVFMCTSGILLTALAYRPKQITENWWDWTNRFYESETSRVAGPMLVVLSLVLHCASVGYCLAKRSRKSQSYNREEEESTEAKSVVLDLENDNLDVKQLLHHNHDIACFPDGSLRCSRSRFRTASENESFMNNEDEIERTLNSSMMKNTTVTTNIS